MDLIEAAHSFFKTQWRSRKGLDREVFEAWQQKALQKWLKEELPKVDFYSSPPRQLQDLPIIDKSVVMENFEAFNTRRLTANQVRGALKHNATINGLTVGASTGTSGHRGLFVISEREKFRWLGNILAKAMPDMVFKKQRVAILLPQGSQLYDSANKTNRITLTFFNLADDPEQWRARLENFNPTVIVAPPKMLRHMVEQNYRLSPSRIFSAAETLDPVDRPPIETYFKSRLEKIYMATEGLFAVTCREGNLHLAEDAVYFEYEEVGNGLVSPIVTSFQRTTQIMARYRMNDLLRLSQRPCACGSPLQMVDEVVGRMDDCFEFQKPSGTVLITPDVLRNAVLSACNKITDFRLCQTATDKVRLCLQNDLPNDDVEAARAAVHQLISARDVEVEIETETTSFALDTSRKLRRVERCVDREKTS